MSKSDFFSKVYKAKLDAANLMQEVRKKDPELAEKICMLYALDKPDIEFSEDFFERLEKVRSQSKAVGELSISYAKINKKMREIFDKDHSTRYLKLFEHFFLVSSLLYKDEND